jgi:hypothetical protein
MWEIQLNIISVKKFSKRITSHDAKVEQKERKGTEKKTTIDNINHTAAMLHGSGLYDIFRTSHVTRQIIFLREVIIRKIKPEIDLLRRRCTLFHCFLFAWNLEFVVNSIRIYSFSNAGTHTCDT